MERTNHFLIMFIVIISFLPWCICLTANPDIQVTISLLGEEPRIRFTNPVIVAGIWHNVTISLENRDFQMVLLRFFKGETIPDSESRDETSFYEWAYQVDSEQWTDLHMYDGYSYINTTTSKRINDTYIFCVGIKDGLPDISDYYENWTYVVYTDETEIYSHPFLLEKPKIGLARSHADTITFAVNPFEQMNTVGSDYFSIKNIGNIPLAISMDYGAYTTLLTISNSSNRLLSEKSLDHFFILHADAWQPGIIRDIPGTVIGTVSPSLIIRTGVVTFTTSLAISAADLQIYIGHENYEIQPISGSNIVFQYQKEIIMTEGEIKQLPVYVSGDGEATLNIVDDEINVIIRTILTDDQTDLPLFIESSNSSEYIILVEVEALRENQEGILTYELTVEDTLQLFYTTITILPPSENNQTQEIDVPITLIIVVFLIIIVVGYIVITQMKHRGR